MKDGFVGAWDVLPEDVVTRPKDRKPLLIVSAAVVILMLLIASYQYYVGGTIPFLRQPEKFHVDPAPAPSVRDNPI